MWKITVAQSNSIFNYFNQLIRSKKEIEVLQNLRNYLKNNEKHMITNTKKRDLKIRTTVEKNIFILTVRSQESILNQLRHNEEVSTKLALTLDFPNLNS